MIQTAEKSIPCFFRCVFFSAILFIQDLPRDLTDSPTRKKGKNKQTQGSAHLPKSAASLSNKISAKISRWRRPVTNIRTELHKQSRSFEETDRSEIERKYDLLNNRVTSLGSFTGIRFVENDDCFCSSGI